ncbi:hypothetical protein GOODEAATRI_013032, partial [Goodea atripinnis]
LSLEIMTLQPRCEDVETAEGVAITVTGVAQVTPLSGFHVPGTLTVEQIYQDRDQFAKLVRDVAAPDVGRMGIEILSFTIKIAWVIFWPQLNYESNLAGTHKGAIGLDVKYQLAPLGFQVIQCKLGPKHIEQSAVDALDWISPWVDVYDKLDYLSSLGKTQIAAVQRDADIGVAEAERDAGIRVIRRLLLEICFSFVPLIKSAILYPAFQEAECKKEMMDVKFLADTKMADSKRELELQKAAFNQEINTKPVLKRRCFRLKPSASDNLFCRL